MTDQDSPGAAPVNTGSGPASVLESAGAAIFVLMAGLVPLFFVPPKLAVLDTAAHEIVFFKAVVARFLCTGLFAAAALRLAFGARIRWSAAALPAAFLAFFVAATLVSVLASPDWRFALRNVTTEWALAGSVLLAPLFLNNLKRLRAVVMSATVAALLAAALGLVAAAGFSGIYKLLYSVDPIDYARRGMQAMLGGVEGGPLRAAMMSTLGNPEYSGTFFAGGFLLAYCWVLDGWGIARLRTRAGWTAGVIVCALFGLAILASQTRSALLAVFAGVVARWLASLPVRGWVIAIGLLATLAVGFAAGIVAAAVVLLAGCACVLAWQATHGELRPRWNALPARTRYLFASVPVAMVALVLVGFVYDPVGLRLRELVARLSSATSTADLSTRQRLIFYLMASEMARLHPLTGIGPGFFPAQFHDILARLAEADPTGLMLSMQIELRTWVAHETHSDYLQIAAERGVPALIAFLGLMTAVLAGLVRRARRGGHGCELAGTLSAAFVGYLTIMLASFPLQEAARQATFFALLAAAFGLLALREDGEPDGGTA